MVGMNRFKMLFKRPFCPHYDRAFIRNTHGDEINWCGGKRSVWICKDCHKVIWDKQLNLDALNDAERFGELINKWENTKE